ncbi:MAG: HAD family hydrolase [Chitinophagaceae bacterium]|nr:HAD family hydrolase [Chitinophagaceae bacterium]
MILSQKRPAVFLDRDGVINENVETLTLYKDFHFIKKSEEAIRLLNTAGFLCIVITNQSLVGRGILSLEGLEAIHKQMQTSLKEYNAYIDKIYFCPHHPQYQPECVCRKPGIGMIQEAYRDFNIDTSRSYLVGDATRDIKAGMDAGLKTILVKTGWGGSDGHHSVQPNYIANNLYSAVEIILQKYPRA